MPSKYQLVNEMTKETLNEITTNGEKWVSFLNTASNNYKYSFNEQVLIYAQKPNATACADIETWNKKLKRWVNKGAKGIALLSIENGRNVLRHVFDISDTHSGINQELKLWTVKSSYENGLIETLENSFGNLEIKDNLSQAIFSSSVNLVEDNFQDYLVDLKDVIQKSSLETLSDFDLESYFKGLLINSVSYITMRRCGIDPMKHFNVSDFDSIALYNTKSVIARLGAATSDISELELREIYSSVRNFEKSENKKIYTFEENEKNHYHKDKEIKIERGNENERNIIQTNGRLSDTNNISTKNQENGTREIFKNEGEISERTQKRTIRGINARWQNGRTFRRNRKISPKHDKRINSEISRKEPSERRVESNESNEMGSRNEFIQKPGRGNSNSRTDLQLNLFNDTYIPPIKKLPTIEEQMTTIEKQVEVENTSAFSFTQEMIDKALISGSNFSNSKFRIYEQFKRSLSSSENVIFLKNEYGIGGSSAAYSGADFGQEHDSKGIKLYKGFKENRPEILLTWNKVEQRLKELIKLDKFFDNEERQQYEEWLKNNYDNEKWMLDRGLNRTEKEDNQNLITDLEDIQIIDNTSEIIKEDTSIENVKFKIGQIIYLESDRKYRVEAINKELDKIILLDQTMLETVHYPITRDESYLKAVSLYLNNDLNFYKNISSKNNDIEQTKETKNITDKINYSIKNDLIGEGTPKEKVKNNIESIKLLKKLESEKRLATKEEQEILAKYVGWGGLPDVFDEKKENWIQEYNELKELLTEEEYKSARASTLTAFYTPPIVVKAIYKTLQNMGLEQANILEPSCGTGNFLGMLPPGLQNSKLYGVELDSISGRIAQQLYQKADIKITGFENADLPDAFFDVAIGNVPFGDFKVLDKRYDKNNFLIHDYFFGKTLDKVKPGGIIAFITSKGTLDKASPDVRKYIAQRADLLGAIRLPENTFLKNAGTKVTSDIIFLQKRENLTDIMPDWVYLDKDENDISINKYFIDNPEMILGKMEIVSTAYGYDSTCKPDNSQSLEEQLNYAIINIHGELQETYIENEIEQVDTSIPALPDVKNFSYTLVDNKIYFRENSKMILQDDLPLTNQNRIRGLISLREQTRELIDYQMQDYSDEEIHIAQAKLNSLYDRFTKEYGIINSRANENAFSNDSSYFLLCSLEKLDGEGNFIGKADMFNKRTIRAKKEITRVDTADEALIISLKDKAKVDLEYMHKLCNIDTDIMIKNLEGVIYNVPEYGDPNVWVTADEYLSGNIREKLKMAEEFAKEDPKFNINVEKLKEVMPKDLGASEIGIKLGATWIPPEIIKDFIFDILNTPFYRRWDIKVRYSPITAEWHIDGKSSDRDNVKSYSTYGTTRINAYKIIEQTLNLKDVKIFDTIIDEEGRKQRVLNRKETAIASSKQDAIKEAFLNWVWEDPERRNKLVKIYNEKFNSIRPREYNGSHIEFVGMNPEIKLRQHQLNAVAHVLYGNNVLLAHEVGAGKTFEMVAAAMESKRLGLCNKSLFVVPNHIIEQFASEFLQLYPSANILVATKKDFETKNRKKFCSRIATGDFDAVIIGHSQFERIPMSVKRQIALLESQINDITVGIGQEKANRGENYTIKQMEKTRKSLEARLAKLNNQEKKDDVVTFEELGVDKLFVDEAHNYKNCARRCYIR